MALFDEKSYGNIRNSFHSLENWAHCEDTEAGINSDGSYVSPMRQRRWVRYASNNPYAALPKIDLNDTHKAIMINYPLKTNSVEVQFIDNKLDVPKGQGRSVGLAVSTMLSGFKLALHYSMGHLGDDGLPTPEITQQDLMKGIQ